LEPTIYRITVRGCLTERLVAAFEELNVEPGIEQTALVGEIRDQSHLYGVLDLMRELGLDLVSVETNRGTSGPDDGESARLKGQCGTGGTAPRVGPSDEHQVQLRRGTVQKRRGRGVHLGAGNCEPMALLPSEISAGSTKSSSISREHHCPFGG
jgi:hypothetical protein